MGRQTHCTGTTLTGAPCRAFAVSDRGLCVSHDPEYRRRKTDGSRRGGEGKASARRAAKQWVIAGETIAPSDLPAMLRGAILLVRDGDLSPSQAMAVAALARASVGIMDTIELEQRIEALERIAREEQR